MILQLTTRTTLVREKMVCNGRRARGKHLTGANSEKVLTDTKLERVTTSNQNTTKFNITSK